MGRVFNHLSKMSMFDKIRKSLGMQTKDEKTFSSGKGHTLGVKEPKPAATNASKTPNLRRANSAPVPVPSSSSSSSTIKSSLSAPASETDNGRKEGGPEGNPKGEDLIFDVAYSDATLGMTFLNDTFDAQKKIDTSVVKDQVVNSVINESESHRNGIQVGDVILSVEGNAVRSFDDFTMLVKALERPLHIRFRRPCLPPTAPLQRSNSTGSNGSGSALSEAELAERREANIRAAENRADAWDRRVKTSSTVRKDKEREKEKRGGGGGAGMNAHKEAAERGNSIAATQAAAKAAKATEAHLAASMGYNPFQPHMSFSSASGCLVTESSGAAATATATAGNLLKGSPRNGSMAGADDKRLASTGVFAFNSQNMPAVELTEDDEETVDLALGMLLSNEIVRTEDNSENDIVKICVATVCKLLDNLTSSNGEEKFRSIRVGNAAISSKVLVVPGGLQLLLAAGFVEQEENGEGFLKHAYDSSGEALARHVLSRLLDLQS